MLAFLRKILRRPSERAAAADQSSDGPARCDLEPLVLDRFLKPRRLDKSAPGWPDDLSRPVVEALIERGDLAKAPLDKQIATACRVVELKSMLKERGLSVSGTKPVLMEISVTLYYLHCFSKMVCLSMNWCNC